MKTIKSSRGFLLSAALAVFLPSLSQAGWKDYEQADAIIGRDKLPSPVNLHMPNGVAVSSSGKVYVVDTGYNRVLRFSSAAALGNGQPAEAVFGQPDFHSGDPGTSQTSLSYPSRATIDAAGNLWVSEMNNYRIMRWADADNAPTGSPAAQVLGQVNFTSRVAGTTQSRMGWPTGMTVDSLGRLWVADYPNNRVLRFDDPIAKGNGGAADGLIGQASFTSSTNGLSATTFNGPTDVAVDAQGRLWVADAFNRRVLRFDSPAAQIMPSADGVLGQPDFVSNATGSGPGQMNFSFALQVSPAGSLFSVDRSNRRIMRWDHAAAKPNGADADGVLGRTGLASNSGDSTISGRIYQNSVAICLDQSGRLWLADSGKERILRWDNVALKGNGAPADGVIGDAGTGVLGLDVNPVAKPASPRAGVEDPQTGKFFVADANRVLRYPSRSAAEAGGAPEAFLGTTTPAELSGDISSEQLLQAWGLALDAAGTLWVCDEWANRIVAFANASNDPTGATMSRVLGQADFDSSESGLAQDRLNAPRGLALDASGNLYVADYGNHRVLRYNNIAGKASGAVADAVIGQPDFITASTAAGNQLLKNPSGICVDVQGRLWVADTGKNRVARYDVPMSVSPSDPPSGTLGGNAAATPSGMNQPTSVVVTSSGRLWVMDYGFNRILRFENAAAKPNGADADGLLGAPTLNNGLNNNRTLRIFSRPECIFPDATGNLWVSDNQNARLLRFTPDIAAIVIQNGMNAGGKFELTFQATASGTFIVRSSTDLKSWSLEATHPLTAGASQVFIDTKGGPRRFFRVEEQ
jgi:sugar lactone lactonase YvrE